MRCLSKCRRKSSTFGPWSLVLGAWSVLSSPWSKSGCIRRTMHPEATPTRLPRWGPRGGAPNAAAALGTPGRLARLGATPDFHHGLFSPRSVPGPSVLRPWSVARGAYSGARTTVQRTDQGLTTKHQGLNLIERLAEIFFQILDL